MNYTIENFINFCDDMMIAEEGFGNNNLFQNIKSGFIKFFTMILNGLEKLIKKIPNGKIKTLILATIKKAKNGLNKSKKINDKTTEEEINEIKDIQEEVQEEVKEINESMNNNDTSNDKDVNPEMKEWMKNYKSPKKKQTKMQQILDEHGYIMKDTHDRDGNRLIMLTPIQFPHFDNIEQLIISNPGENGKEFFTRIGWL